MQNKKNKQLIKMSIVKYISMLLYYIYKRASCINDTHESTVKGFMRLKIEIKSTNTKLKLKKGNIILINKYSLIT